MFPLEDSLEDLEEQDDIYGLGLENWQSYNVQEVYANYHQFRCPEQFADIYPFAYIGKAEVVVDGRFRKKLFKNVDVTASSIVECEAIVGKSLISLLSDFKMEEDSSFINAFIQD